MNKYLCKLSRSIILVLFLFFSTTRVEAVPIDSKLNKGKSSVEYIEQLIEDSKELGPSGSVKVELLQRLKNIHVNDIEFGHKVTLPIYSNSKSMNSDKFWKAFQSVSKFIGFVESIEDKIEDLERKSAILRRNILKATKESDEVQNWQIQYAIYWLRIKNLNEATPTLKKEAESLKENLYKMMANVSYSTRKSEKDLAKIKLEKVKIENELMLLSIKLDQDESKSLVQQKRKVLDEFEKIQLRLIRSKIERSFTYLKDGKTKASLMLILESRELLDNVELSNKNKSVIQVQIDLAQYLLGKNISAFDLLQYNTSHSFIEVVDKALSLISEPIIFYDDKKITIWGTIKFILIFTFGFFLAQLYKRRINSIDHGRYNIAATNKTIISNLGYYLIVLITFFAALNLLGLDLSSLTVVAGALSVGIGFGLQKIFANFMSGLIMMFEKSIKMGDYIEVSSSLRGRVTEIRMRSSTITTNDNISLIIPNSTLIESNVINWTLNDTIVRLQIPFSVAYGTSYKELEKAVLVGLEDSDLNYLKHDKSRESELRMTQMNTSGVDYCLLVWVSGISTKFSEKTKSEFLKFIYNSLAEHEIEIPFPQLDIHVKDGLTPKD